MSIVKTRLSFDCGKTVTRVDFPGEKCDDGMDLLLAIEKLAGGPPPIDQRWNALEEAKIKRLARWPVVSELGAMQ